MSKYYGESEKRFADIFETCKKLGIKNYHKENLFFLLMKQILQQQVEEKVSMKLVGLNFIIQTNTIHFIKKNRQF